MQFKIYFKNKIYLHRIPLKGITFQAFEAELIKFLSQRIHLESSQTLKLEIQYLDINEHEKIEVQCTQDFKEIMKHYKQQQKSASAHEQILKFYISSKNISNQKTNDKQQLKATTQSKFIQTQNTFEDKFNQVVNEEEKLPLQKDINPFELQTCEKCGRKFNPSSYQKHIKICQAQTTKREVFNSKKQRELSATNSSINEQNEEEKCIKPLDNQNKQLCELCGRSFAREYFIKHAKLCYQNLKKQKQPTKQQNNQLDEQPILVNNNNNYTLSYFTQQEMKCPICNRTFLNETKLTQHMFIHKERNKFISKDQRVTGQMEHVHYVSIPNPICAESIVECSKGCGRKFLMKNVQAHENVCVKLFQNKPQKYQSKLYRWKKYLQDMEALEKEKRYNNTTSNSEKQKVSSLTMQPFAECQICHRKFREALINDHEKYCIKLKNKKKYLFDSKKHRIPNQTKTDISLTDLLNQTFEQSSTKHHPSKSTTTTTHLFEYFTIPFPSSPILPKFTCFNCKLEIKSFKHYYQCFICKINICEKCEEKFEHFHPLFKIKGKEQEVQIKEFQEKIVGQSFISGQEFDMIFDNLELESQDSKKVIQQ